MSETSEVPSLHSADKLTQAPSHKSWEVILHEASIGNWMYPQAFFAQGIRLAFGIVDQAKKNNLPITSFFENSPPKDLIDANVSESRDKAHATYGIKTQPSGVTMHPLRNVWESDIHSARRVMRNFATVLDSQSSEDTSYPDTDLQRIERAAQDPMFYDLLSFAVKGLELKSVRERSHAYKQEIVDYMTKYSRYNFSKIPEEYNTERSKLGDSLSTLLEEAATEIKREVVKATTAQDPERTELSERLNAASVQDLFGDLQAAAPHPLRHPDYE